ncbi:hypothetical protein [Neobacillus ginsengisoli]|uniref:Uncharacterized protein n=1 Tax=Neobacillus ginsengisoli TaxID=904295 RepID=A0ABT9XZX3_9BACI|nr:hypothetical protein [Neobacillus ginsengisoli]MDQ0201122.1 hypothetical protein [Neobacillus ginsengisoli]
MNIEKISISNQDYKNRNGYKVIEVNVSYPSESLYAVCTPIKKQ